MSAQKTEGHELHITRVFDGPPSLVFEIFTDPEHVKEWSGPRGFETLSIEGEVRTGARYRRVARGPDGNLYIEIGEYREIEPNTRLVFTHGWENDGEAGPMTVVTVTFEPHAGNKTKMVFHQAFFAAAENRDGHRDGWSESFDMLAEHLAKLV